jgi:hypothetical protein
MLDEDKHVYYWAWAEEDNPDAYRNPQLYRVFRSQANGRLSQRIHDEPVTEAMTKGEAIAYCERIVKLTGGREI